MVGKDKAYWAKLNDERLEIEARIHARARLDHALDGRYTLLPDEKDKLLDLIRGHSIAADAIRYMEIQNEFWDDAGIKDSKAHMVAPNSGTVDME